MATPSCFYFFICFAHFVNLEIKLKSFFVDFITSSSPWGANLPSPLFFLYIFLMKFILAFIWNNLNKNKNKYYYTSECPPSRGLRSLEEQGYEGERNISLTRPLGRFSLKVTTSVCLVSCVFVPSVHKYFVKVLVQKQIITKRFLAEKI